jgi:hypothetical protein
MPTAYASHHVGGDKYERMPPLTGHTLSSSSPASLALR